uniref:EGF-like domain-containing protein n=1 Tax=Trichuris muris TaxID=70415 RepID=A0A5S6Q3N7_TRIMR
MDSRYTTSDNAYRIAAVAIGVRFSDINECKNIECVNGYCVDMVNDCKCECFHGWTGTNCTSKLDPCDSPFFECINGSCVLEVDLPRCLCPPGHTGTFCEISLSACQFYPCKNGGTCVDLGLNYECICERPFRGLDCSIVLRPCTPSRCVGAATCIVDYSVPGGFRCKCPKGFYGYLCAIPYGLVIRSSALPARENAVELAIALILVLAFNSEAVWVTWVSLFVGNHYVMFT